MRQLTRTRLFILALLPLFLVAACDNTVEPPGLPEVPVETVMVVDALDEENGGEGKSNYTDFEQFNVVDGCVDLHGNGYFDAQPGNGLYIDMDGSCDKAGTIETKEVFTFDPDQEYVLEMWLAGNNQVETDDSMDVSLGDFYLERFRIDSDEPFALYTRRFEVSSESQGRLRFEHFGGDTQGILLDLVRIRTSSE